MFRHKIIPNKILVEKIPSSSSRSTESHNKKKSLLNGKDKVKAKNNLIPAGWTECRRSARIRKRDEISNIHSIDILTEEQAAEVYCIYPPVRYQDLVLLLTFLIYLLDWEELNKSLTGGSRAFK